MRTLLQNPFDQPNGRPFSVSGEALAVADNQSLQPTFGFLGNENTPNAELSGNRNVHYGFGGNPLLAGQADFNSFNARLYSYGVGDLRDQYPTTLKK